MIQNATGTYDGESFTYKDVCARWQGECFENDILNLDQIMDDVSFDNKPFHWTREIIKFLCLFYFFDDFIQIESGNLTLTFPLMFNPVTWDTHVFPVFFGGTVLSADRTIDVAPSMQLVYFVAVDTQRQIEKWAIVLHSFCNFETSLIFLFFFRNKHIKC